MSEPAFETFGQMLKHLRRRAHMTQLELGAAVGYSEAYITRLEGDSRLPIPGIVESRFVDALRLRAEPDLARRLVELAKMTRDRQPGAVAHPVRAKGPTNVLAQLSRFIGRASELDNVIHLLHEHRMVTITGSGGVGKTRLALVATTALAQSFPDGVRLVELAPVTDAILVPLTVARALGMRDFDSTEPADAVCAFLADKQLLIVLDNCEHLVEACAAMVDAVLRACPGTHVLATSREALRIPGEVTWRVPPMASTDASLLFADRAAAVRPEFALTNTNAATVAAISERLDGIPLAIELAAARIKLMSAEQVLGRLDDIFRLLTGGARTALPRQRTLRASIDWSYGLLTESEGLLLRRLSVFSGGFALDAAEGACAGGGILPVEILDLLTQLVNKSLVVVVGHAQNEETRYRMLEAIRQYANEHLVANGASADARTRHLQFFLGLAERAEMELTGPRQVAWLDRLEADLANLRSALGWALETNVDSGLRMVSALMNFWGAHGHHRDASERLTELLSRPQGLAEPLVRAKALSVQAFLLLERGDVVGRARLSAEEGLAMFRALGDKHGIAFSLEILGTVLAWANYYSEAQRIFRECLAISRELDDKYLASKALANMGFWSPPGDYSTKRKYYEESLALGRELGHVAGIGNLLMHLGRLALDMGNFALGQSLLEESLSTHAAHGSQATLFAYVLLGDAAFYMGDLERAREHYEHYLVVSQESGRLALTRMAVLKLGQVALHQGDPMQARAHLERAWPFYGRSNSTFLNLEINYFLEALANLAVAEKRFTSGARLFAWVAAFRRSTGSPLRQTDRKMATLGGMASIHAQLDEATLAAATAAGEALTLEEAVEDGLAVADLN